ncbi:MAG: long-chain fatty acid--CoA ligase [Acidobacteriota bacterium]
MASNPPVTVLDCLRRRAEELGDAVAYGEMVAGEWTPTATWSEYHLEVRQFARAALHLGYSPKSCLAILAANRPEWAIACLGASAARAVPVGIYQTCSPEQVAYILKHSESPLVVVEDLDQLAKVQSVRDQLPALQHMVVMRGVADADVPKDDGVFSWNAYQQLAEQTPDAELDARLAEIRADDLASLIYTSGTTGRPKAVMLNHRNIVETCRIGEGLHDLSAADSLVSYLPMAHIAEQMMSIHMPAYCGYRVCFLDQPLNLLTTLQAVQPSVFFGVPRVWERVHSGMSAKLGAASAPLRAALSWAMGTGRKVAERRGRGQAIGPLLALQWRLADGVLLGKIRTKVGFENIRIASSGAAPIARDILDFFAGLGVLIYEVYGLSETTGPGTWNHAGRTRLGTVGPALPGVEVRIAEDGEVLFRGPNVFQGYFKAEDVTAEAIDADGYFHTGDLGQVDSDGFLSITGRKKELIITSGGKNIAPAGVEGELKQIDLVGDAVAVGDGQRFIAALLTLEEEAIAAFAAERGIEGALHEHPEVLDAVRDGIRRANRQLARVETVRNFRVLPRRLTPDAGEMTPTLKIKRAVVHERYADEIAAIYAEGQTLSPDG